MNRIRRNWTSKEDSLLQDLVQKELDNARPLLWRELAKHIPGRSNKDCRKRWWNSLAGGKVKGAWSPEEDKRLIEAVEQYGTNWPQVAAFVGSRCGDQCSSHWRQVLNPNINYCDWTTEEDEQLLHAVRIYGTNWSTIASFHTPQRTTLALKNRYWKLRQRSQSEAKSSSGKSSSAPSPPAKGKVAKRPSNKTTRSSGDDDSEDDDADDDDDYDEAEHSQRNEDGDAEEQDVEINNLRGQDPSCANWLGDWTVGKAVSDRKPSSPTTPSVWTEYQKSPMAKILPRYAPTEAPTEQWIESMTSQGMTGSSTPLYPDESFLSTPDNEHRDFTSMPFVVHDEDAMNLDFTTLDGSLYLEPDMFKDYSTTLPGDLGAPTSPFPTLDPMTPDPANKDSTPGLVDPALADKAGEPLSHRVSINLSCTTGQLSNIMSLVASTGLVVNIKIDTQ